MMQLIDSRKKFTARELAERFDVSVRTIQRDLDYLQQIGFPLYAEVGPHGGYRALPNRILPPLQLTQNEAFGLFLMIQALEKIADFPFQSIRSHLAEQYYAGLPDDIQDGIDRMRKHIVFNQPQPRAVSPFTTLILQAAMDKQALKFQYEAPAGVKAVQAFPVGIFHENGFWYMPARNKDRVLLYRVDRIIEAEGLALTDESLPTLLEWMASADERNGVEVVLQFTSAGVRLAGTERMFSSLTDGEWRVPVPEEEFPFLARQLLKFGPEVKVVWPLQLQNMVVDLLRRNMNQYGG
ncbi:hypothetical protein PF010_g2681 [Phytophthora fragariae]|uniref:HTH deoR-type domain-containing protein n=1 Tax=Phytophthora fragariae TaxID=53985 RepID=A0A6G0LWS5_9STRA|nr:hypothetical protein PF010_g2681 [Phytophthora fragariae]